MRIASSRRSVPSASELAVYSGVSKDTATWRLGAEIVDLVGLHLRHHADQVGGVGQVAVMQLEAGARHVAVVVQMVDAAGVEGGGAALDAVHLIPLLEQQFREIGAVLAGDAGDEGDLATIRHHVPSVAGRPARAQRGGPKAGCLAAGGAVRKWPRGGTARSTLAAARASARREHITRAAGVWRPGSSAARAPAEPPRGGPSRAGPAQPPGRGRLAQVGGLDPGGQPGLLEQFDPPAVPFGAAVQRRGILDGEDLRLALGEVGGRAAQGKAGDGGARSGGP